MPEIVLIEKSKPSNQRITKFSSMKTWREDFEAFISGEKFILPYIEMAPRAGLM